MLQKFLRFITLFLVLIPTASFGIDTPEPDPQTTSFESLLFKSIELTYVNLDSSFQLLQQAKEVVRQTGDKHQEGKLENELGKLHYVKGDYATSMKHFSNALEIFESIQEKEGFVYALNGRGLIYLSQHDYPNAIDIWNRCIEINTELNDSLSLGKNHFNISIAQSELKEFDQALESAISALFFLDKYKENPLYAMALNRLAKIYFEKGELEKATETYEKVLELDPEVTNWEKAFAHTGLAELAVEKGEIEKAIQFGQAAMEYAQMVKALWDKEWATKILAEAYARQGDFQNAFHYASLNKSYSDSLYSENKNAEISYLQLQLAEKDNQALHQEVEAGKSRTRYFIIIAVILTLSMIVKAVALILYRRNLRQKDQFNRELQEKQREIQAQKEKLEAMNEEKNKLFSILSHDLKAPINSVKQILELEERGLLTEEEYKSIRKILIKQVDETEQMIGKLLRWSHAQLNGILTNRTPIDLQALIKEQINHTEYQTFSKNIKIEFEEGPEAKTILADLQQVQIVVLNCLHNAIKFSKPNGIISIWASENEKYLELHIQDEGTGISSEKLNEINSKLVQVTSTEGTNQEKGTGLGLLLVRQFMDKNQGIFQIKSVEGKGTEVILSFEKATVLEMEPEES
ncbi:tetratricopeptide repeat protein [Algoriphagus sp. CAU 1675]|uniref:tetratricopeptide repeat-containing sensor histidine kinase n=1 Tax=Algoriphagus sp. CAU 1675 TaxID=3032597 RepID=UPI0023DCC051|nr:tetratricopeptide repeat protein [Algoriphagus sp. CAU 1675]MDF2158488.1 tetratricopeptide repeat protein [Algoriphagus sp. CAU 1675]